MKKIYKYKFELGTEFTIDLPTGAEILKIDYRYGECVFWALVDPGARIDKTRFAVIATGGEVDEYFTYIDTFYYETYVWHLFKIN